MYEIEDNKGIRYFITSYWRWILFAIVLAILIKANWSIYQSYEASQRALRFTIEKEQTITKREEGLQRDISFLKTDKGVESEIRSLYGMTKEGEEVFIVKEGKDSSASSSGSSDDQAGFFRRISVLLFGEK